MFFVTQSIQRSLLDLFAELEPSLSVEIWVCLIKRTPARIMSALDSPDQSHQKELRLTSVYHVKHSFTVKVRISKNSKSLRDPLSTLWRSQTAKRALLLAMRFELMKTTSNRTQDIDSLKSVAYISFSEARKKTK